MLECIVQDRGLYLNGGKSHNNSTSYDPHCLQPGPADGETRIRPMHLEENKFRIEEETLRAIWLKIMAQLPI